MVVDEFADQVDRLVDRLRSLPIPRLTRTSDGQPSIADSAYALAQVFADLSADLDQRTRRDIPRLNALASGDQVAVTANDLVAAAQSADPGGGPAVEVALVATRALRERV